MLADKLSRSRRLLLVFFALLQWKIKYGFLEEETNIHKKSIKVSLHKAVEYWYLDKRKYCT